MADSILARFEATAKLTRPNRAKVRELLDEFAEVHEALDKLAAAYDTALGELDTLDDLAETDRYEGKSHSTAEAREALVEALGDMAVSGRAIVDGLVG